MGNEIKGYQLDLYAGRTSAATLRVNQLRLWFASMAYVLLGVAPHRAASHSVFKATCGTIRLKAAQDRSVVGLAT
jgi:hypothetical protein